MRNLSEASPEYLLTKCLHLVWRGKQGVQEKGNANGEDSVWPHAAVPQLRCCCWKSPGNGLYERS